MKRALPALALLAACSTTIAPTASGEFSSPTGLAVTSGGDRDVLFVANEGRDNLRALQMCSNPLLADGGVDPADPCPPKENFQFVPAPIRVFPATIETGDRPRRLAGVRLTRGDQGKTGVVLAGGADDALRVIDARNVVEAGNRKTAAAAILSLALPAPAVDVVAENPLDAAGLEEGSPAGQAATAFVATVAAGTTPAQLLMLSVGLDAQGNAAVPVITGKCALDPVVPRKLATVPGGGDRVYVADGAGDGVVAIAKAGIPAPADPPPACTMERISAGGRAARSVAVSPAWYEGATAHPAGELLVMVLEPRLVSTGGQDLDPGGVVIARTADKLIVPVPPSGLFDATAGLQAMEPITTSAIPREVTFLRAVSDPVNCPSAPCTPIFIAAIATPIVKFGLVAAVTSTDGGTYFVDVERRRLISISYYLAQPLEQTPFNNIEPLLTPSVTGATLVFAAPDATHPLPGWFTAGVTHTAHWRVVFHGPFPGLETRGGFLTDSGHGTMLFKLPGVNLAPWVADPALQLAAGDLVTFLTYTVPSGSPQACTDAIAQESQAPARFELTILGLPAADTLELAPLQAAPGVRPFDLSSCPAGLGAVASVRVGGDRPWLVSEGLTVRGRAKPGELFVANGRRFDYPLDYAADEPPVSSTDVAAAFTLGGTLPTLPGSAWSFSLSGGLDPLVVRDTTQSQGFATTVLTYNSARHRQLVFTSVTGGNSVVQADPTILLSGFNGVLIYR